MKKLLANTVLLFLVSCSPVHVSTKVSHNADFSKYETFAWQVDGAKRMKVKNPANIHPGVREKVRKQIDSELTKKGLVKSELESADLVFRRKEAVENVEPRSGGLLREDISQVGVVAGDPNYERPDRHVVTDTYRRGTMIVEALDADTKEVVWTGKVQGIIDDMSSTDAEIRKFVLELMKRFPEKG